MVLIMKCLSAPGAGKALLCLTLMRWGQTSVVQRWFLFSLISFFCFFFFFFLPLASTAHCGLWRVWEQPEKFNSGFPAKCFRALPLGKIWKQITKDGTGSPRKSAVQLLCWGVNRSSSCLCKWSACKQGVHPSMFVLSVPSLSDRHSTSILKHPMIIAVASA